MNEDQKTLDHCHWLGDSTWVPSKCAHGFWDSWCRLDPNKVGITDRQVTVLTKTTQNYYLIAKIQLDCQGGFFQANELTLQTYAPITNQMMIQAINLSYPSWISHQSSACMFTRNYDTLVTQSCVIPQGDVLKISVNSSHSSVEEHVKPFQKEHEHTTPKRKNELLSGSWSTISEFDRYAVSWCIQFYSKTFVCAINPFSPPKRTICFML